MLSVAFPVLVGMVAVANAWNSTNTIETGSFISQGYAKLDDTCSDSPTYVHGYTLGECVQDTHGSAIYSNCDLGDDSLSITKTTCSDFHCEDNCKSEIVSLKSKLYNLLNFHVYKLTGQSRIVSRVLFHDYFSIVLFVIDCAYTAGYTCSTSETAWDNYEWASRNDWYIQSRTCEGKVGYWELADDPSCVDDLCHDYGVDMFSMKCVKNEI